VPAPGAVVVAGASSGIGRACALRLAAGGRRVFAGVRSDADARALAAQAPPALAPLRLDVTDADALAAAARAVEAEVGGAGLAGLVNAAGVAAWGPLELLPPASLHEAFAVNAVGAVAVTRAFLPLVRRARGRIVHVGSISGEIALPYLGAYSGSKAALAALCDALRLELRGDGVAVSLVEAGRIATPIWSRAAAALAAWEPAPGSAAHERYAAAFRAVRAAGARPHGLPPERVAEVVERALAARRPRARYVVGRDARRQRWLRFLPVSWRDAWLARRMPGANTIPAPPRPGEPHAQPSSRPVR
jgi:NAD(P)-dependent dehydrogenase (short-subunit alcohol dehydrogenase family)